MNKKIVSMFLISLMLVGILFGITVEDKNIIYVDLDASGYNDGSSWKNAFNKLQDALSVSESGDVIWVAEGTYYPTDNDDTSISFKMVDDVDIYGGFSGNETSVNERNWEENVTVLSGEIGKKNDSSDNSVKVVIAANNLIDGFTISDGTFSQNIQSPSGISSEGTNQSGRPSMQGPDGNSGSSKGHSTPDAVTSGDAASSISGNGIIIWQVSPIIKNCIITNNAGGKGAGVYIMGTGDLDEVPTFINTIISNNTASSRGGGVSIDMRSEAIFIDCIFDSNECTTGKGGAIYNDYGGNPLIENCLFINNYAESGAALGNDGVSNPVISNTTFFNNTASEAGAALYQGTGPFNDPLVVDSIMWGNNCVQDKISIYNWNECNPKVEYSIIEGGYDGEGVIDTDPMFVDAAEKNFNLKDSSPALTAGIDGDKIGFDAEIIETRTEEDYQEIIDYLYSIERNEEPTQMDVTNPVEAEEASEIGEIVYVDDDATGENDGSSFVDAFTSLQEAIDYAGAAYELTGTEVELWVAEGIYYTGSERSDSFILRTGVTVYGGFDGTESSADERNYSENKTILSGEIGDISIKTDNSYHILIGADDAILDGFTITGGYADGVDGEIYDNKGGGILNYLAGKRVRPSETPTLGFDIVVNNCIFTDNYAEEGGAIYTYHGGNLEVNNCSFINNKAQYGGAILERAGTNAIYSNCIFTGNSAVYKGGASFVDYGAMVQFYYCEFEENISKTAGGAIYVIDRASQEVQNETDFYLIDENWESLTDIFSAVYIDGCTFVNNTAGTNGGALYVYDGAYGKIIDSYFENNSANDAVVVASNSGKVIIDESTTKFLNNSPEDTFADGFSSSIRYE